MLTKTTCVTHFVPATLRECDRWYLEFQYQCIDGSMKRCRKYISCVVKRLKTLKEKRAYAAHEVDVINQKLRAGWTPEQDRALKVVPKSGATMTDVLTEYREWIYSSEKKGELRHPTVVSYASFVNLFERYVKDSGITYIYMLTADRVRHWLVLCEESGASIKTQQNYRRWLRSYCNWMITRGYMKENPVLEVKGAETTSKERRAQEKRKNSKYIEPAMRHKILEWCELNDRQLKLAIMLEYFCFIRPHEMMQLEVGLFSLHDGLLFIPDRISKNGMDAYITVPDVVLELMLDLRIFEQPSNAVLFDNHLQCNVVKHIDRGDAMRDRWMAMRNAAGIPDRVKFYNLKHTGITDMMERVGNPRLVQLQARHQSIQQTEAYSQKHKPTAFDEIRKLK